MAHKPEHEKRRRDGEFEHEKRARGGRLKRARGGRTSESMVKPAEDLEHCPDVDDVYAGQQSNVVKEAKGAMRKRGGRVEDHDMKPEGERSKERLDKKPRRATGGRVGADHSPLSTAAKEKAGRSDPW